jgi:tetratricopeptide (TPR) repeat protein
LDPDFALAWVGLADTYLLQWAYSPLDLDKNEMTAKSRAAVEEALRLDPGLGEAYASVGKRKNMEGDHDGAETAFKRALQLSANYAPAYQWYGELLLTSRDRLDEALELYQTAVMLDPRSAIIARDYGTALRLSGRFEDALMLYRRTVEIEPQFASGYQAMGSILARILGRLDEAVGALKQGFSIDPERWTAANLIGSIYLELGDLQQANYWRDRTLALVPEDVAPDIVIDLHMVRGEVDIAVAYARKDIENDPRYVRSLRLVINDQIGRGELEAARELFEQAYPELFVDRELNIDQQNREAAVELANLLLQTGEQSQAAHLLDRSQAAIALGPYSTLEGFSILEARIHALRGDSERALAALRQAVDQGWRWNSWYFLEHDPVLASLHDEPEFQALKQEVKHDLATQRARLQDSEASGSPSPLPEQ